MISLTFTIATYDTQLEGDRRGSGRPLEHAFVGASLYSGLIFPISPQLSYHLTVCFVALTVDHMYILIRPGIVYSESISCIWPPLNAPGVLFP